MKEAVWDEGISLWRVTTGDGATIRARVLVSAVGPLLSEPGFPKFPAWKNLPGRHFIPHGWDARVPLEGKRVAVIGTGASAIPVCAEIARKWQKLSIFQRTPPWDCSQGRLCHFRALEEPLSPYAGAGMASSAPRCFLDV